MVERRQSQSAVWDQGSIYFTQFISAVQKSQYVRAKLISTKLNDKRANLSALFLLFLHLYHIQT